jgi:hypothetical protein
MAAVTKNRNFFNCPLLLHYKSKFYPLKMVVQILRKVMPVNSEELIHWKNIESPACTTVINSRPFLFTFLGSE